MSVVADGPGCATDADYSKTCPAGWTIVGIQCVAPIDYQGPCATMIDLSAFTVDQKDAYAKACGSPWPCSGDGFLDTGASFLQHTLRDGSTDPQHLIVDSRLQVSQLNVAKKEISKLNLRPFDGNCSRTIVENFRKPQKPCFLKDFNKASETSVSSTGRTFGSISTRVTFVPKALRK